jgi:hypothetical protein
MENAADKILNLKNQNEVDRMSFIVRPSEIDYSRESLGHGWQNPSNPLWEAPDE